MIHGVNYHICTACILMVRIQIQEMELTSTRTAASLKGATLTANGMEQASSIPRFHEFVKFQYFLFRDI